MAEERRMESFVRDPLVLLTGTVHKGRVPKGIITLIQDQKYEVNAYARIDRGIKAIDLYAFAFQFGAFHIIV